MFMFHYFGFLRFLSSYLFACVTTDCPTQRQKTSYKSLSLPAYEKIIAKFPFTVYLVITLILSIFVGSCGNIGGATPNKVCKVFFILYMYFHLGIVKVNKVFHLMSLHSIMGLELRSSQHLDL